MKKFFATLLVTEIAFKMQFNDKNTEKQALTNIELDKQNMIQFMYI